MTSTDTKDGSPSRTEQLEASAQHGAHAAADAGRQATGAVAEQSAAVADTAKQQFESVIGQAKSEIAQQADAQGQQVLRGLHSLTDELSALATGRPEQAGQIGTIVTDAQQRLERYVSSLDARGPQGMLDDVASFARRRPGMFLIGAGIAGFAAGRLVRSASGAHDDAARSLPPTGDWTSQPPGDENTARAAATAPEEPWQIPS